MDDERANTEDLELLLEVSASVDGELPPERREALAERVADDRRCVEEARFYRWLDETAKHDSVPEVDSEEWAALWARIEQRRTEAPIDHSAEVRDSARPRRRWAVTGGLGRLAAAAAIVLAAFGAYQVFGPADDGAAGPPTAEAPPTSPPAEGEGESSPWTPGDDRFADGSSIPDGPPAQPGDAVTAPESELEDPDDGAPEDASPTGAPERSASGSDRSRR